MKKTDANKLYMYETVLHTCAKYTEAWNEIPAFVSGVEQFNTNVEQLWSMVEEHKRPIKNITKEKESLREKLMEEYRVLREIMRMQAMTTDNYELMLVAAPSRSTLLYGKEAICIAHCRNFATAFQTILPELSNLNLNQANLDAFIGLITAFENAVASPRNAIISRRLLTMHISEKVRAIDLHLRFKLDAMIGLLKDNHPDFYKEYHFSRMLIHYASKRPSPGQTSATEVDAPERDDGVNVPPHS